jgi:hypothetical protein
MALDPVTALLDVGSKIIDRLWPDPAQRDSAKLELFKMQQEGELARMSAENGLLVGQIDTNKIEAASPNLFVAGWRPFIGWSCGLACVWNWILLPAISAALVIAGNPVILQPADLSEMMPVLFAMLGIGTLRTIEKIQKVTR